MDKDLIAKAFNEWMRRYTDEPERFESDAVTVKKFLAEAQGETEPSYGQSQTAYLAMLCDEIKAAG